MFNRKPIVGNFQRSIKPVYAQPTVVTHNTDHGRFYEVSPGIYYPSITTVLGEGKDLSGWIDRVGQSEADRIKYRAAAKGNMIHALIERYLKNEPIEIWKENPFVQEAFLKGRSTLDRIGYIWYLERVLWSNDLRVAGRCDCIAKFDDKSSIIDFKGSTKPKEKEWIEDYFCQATAYAYMLYEMYNFQVNQIVIIIFVEGMQEPQVFIENPFKYLNTLQNKIKAFKGKFHAETQLVEI